MHCQYQLQGFISVIVQTNLVLIQLLDYECAVVRVPPVPVGNERVAVCEGGC